jgi:hypothetical protein
MPRPFVRPHGSLASLAVIASAACAAPRWSPGTLARDSLSSLDDVVVRTRVASRGGAGLVRQLVASDATPASDAAPLASHGKALDGTGRDVADPRLLSRCDAPRSIVVYKAARRLELRCGDALAAGFESSLGFAPSGHKEREGDGRTPEGEYALTEKFPSRFHRSLQVNYPNVADADRGLGTGLTTAA